MNFSIVLKAGNVHQYARRTKLNCLIKRTIIVGSILLALLLIYFLIPNPYLCYGYKPIKIGMHPIEFDWTGNYYQCRFDIANAGILTLKNPVLHIYFIDGADITISSQNKEWQKNDDINYIWSKNININGGIRHINFAERAQAINVIFHKKGINRIGYIINSNGFQKKGIIKAINAH